MLRVSDLGDGVNQGGLSVRLEYDVEINSSASGWVAQSLPVDWNGMPGMLDLHVLPRYNGRHEVGGGHCGEEVEHKELDVLHEYRRSARNVRIRRLEIQRGRKHRKRAFHRQNRG